MTYIPSLPPYINNNNPYPLPIYENNFGYPPPPPPPPPENLPPAPSKPSRALFLTLVPSTVSETTIRRDLEIFGDVRAVEMERRRQGLITVHFYDIRNSQAALEAIQQQHMQQQFRLGKYYDSVFYNSMNFNNPPPPPPPSPPPSSPGLISGRVIWAQYTIPLTSGLPDGFNQGTLVIFNLDARITYSDLKQIFEPFGPVKELRETPRKKNQKFVEFYDVRNAALAMAEMNGHEIYGKSIIVDFSRPGGQYNRLHLPRKGPSNFNNSNNPSTRSSIPSSPSTPPPPHSPPQPRWRKGSGSGKSVSSSPSTGSSPLSVHESMNSLYIGGTTTNNRKNTGFKKSGAHEGGGGGGRPWKGGGRYTAKEYDPRFLINEDGTMEETKNFRDFRTTVMIKNIPNKYSQKLLLNMLDNHCIHCNEQIEGENEDKTLSSYDFVYLPIDFINKCNVGYGFVNMTSPQGALRLYKAFHKQNWEVFNSRKICEVTYARLQGLDALREHFKNSKFPGEDEYMPVVFNPPRDGCTLTDPLPIVSESPVNTKEKNQSEQPPEEVATEEEGGCSNDIIHQQ